MDKSGKIIGMSKRIFLPFLLVTLLLNGCASAIAAENPPGAQATVQLPTSPVVLPAETLPPIATHNKPTETPFPAPSATAIPTATAVPTATDIPHPMSIPAMRAAQQAGAYPGSDIIIEQELDPGDNYRRYYASYLSEGLKIYALLTIPNGDPPEGGWPAIVFNHGYIPPAVYQTTERYIAYVDGIARSGYIVFRIDYRGHANSEGSALGAYGDPGYTVDVLNAVTSLQRLPQANSEKIGMWGHSMGGFLTLRAMVINPTIKVGVIWAGVVASYPDMLTRWRRSGPNPTPTAPGFARRWRQDWIELYGTPEENPAFWNSVSANSFLADLGGPIQLHHGTADEDVPTVFSEILAQQMQAAGQTVDLHIYPGDNHNLSGYFSQAMIDTVAFYDRYLK